MLQFWKEQLKYRHAVCFVMFFMLGMIAAENFVSPENPTNIAPAFFVTIAGAVFIFSGAAIQRSHRTKNILIFSIYIAALLFGIAYMNFYTAAAFGEITEFSDIDCMISGRVITTPTLASSGTCVGAVVKISEIEGGGTSCSHGKIMVYFPVDTAPEYGDGVTFHAKPSLPAEKLGSFKYRRFLLTKGCALTAYVSEYDTYLPETTVFDIFRDAGVYVRMKIISYAASAIPDAELGDLLAGIMTGSRDGFTDSLYSAMSNSGFMHIAAVSGLHISFLAFVAEALFRFRDRRAREMFAAIILIFYISVASFTPSVSRAVLMYLYIVLSHFLFKTADALTSLVLSALVLCLINPYCLFSLSFIMSYTAVLFLLIFMPPSQEISTRLCEYASGSVTKAISKHTHIRRQKTDKLRGLIAGALKWLSLSLITSVVCQLGLIPISAAAFGKTAMFSFVGNVIVIPCTMIVFVSAVLCFLLSLVLPQAGIMLSWIFVYPFLRIIYSAAHFFSQFAVTPTSQAGAFSICLYYLICLFLPGLLVCASRKLNNKAEESRGKNVCGKSSAK